MEKKINVKSIELKATVKGAQFAVVIDANGEKYTAWDKGIIEKLGKMTGQEVSCEVKEQGEFKNIRGINDVETVARNISEAVQSINKSDREHSIVSQVILKCASELMQGRPMGIDTGFGMDLRSVVGELIIAYKICLKELNE